MACHHVKGPYTTNLGHSVNFTLKVNLLRYTNWLLCSIGWHYQEVFWGQLTISSKM